MCLLIIDALAFFIKYIHPCFYPSTVTCVQKMFIMNIPVDVTPLLYNRKIRFSEM